MSQSDLDCGDLTTLALLALAATEELETPEGLGWTVWEVMVPEVLRLLACSAAPCELLSASTFVLL